MTSQNSEKLDIQSFSRQKCEQTRVSRQLRAIGKRSVLIQGILVYHVLVYRVLVQGILVVNYILVY